MSNFNYQWVAYYSDGTILEESEMTSSEKIDRSKLTHMVLFCNGQSVIAVSPPPGKLLVYRRRTSINASSGTATIVILIGWQSAEHDSDQSMVVYAVHAPDAIVKLDKWVPNSAWYDKPVFLPIDLVPVG